MGKAAQNSGQVQQRSDLGRKPDGKFAKGHKISVGNAGGRPKEANKREYLDIMRETLTPDKWRQIVEKAIEDATGADAWARAKGREFFSKHVLPQKVEVEWDGEFPVKVVGVEGFEGWGTPSE